ncbi:hypothetical protein FGIG_11354 [Fasciola gigantica]|uniref:Uncharacterized protein n=1 Tax=Fasciola gigantica TaxID=46835 RepID=A0A504YND3_FASGI|nr:hypothetical protein FGIG_11354 [Fasciola gigantica]
MLPQADLIYQIFICSSRKHGFATTANMWIRLHGHLGSTRPIGLPRGRNLITIRNTNLGLLSAIQVGHDNAGPTPKLFVEFIIIYNSVTGHLYMFPCCRWIGRGIEDDALERVLVGHLVRMSPNDPKLIFTAVAADPGDGVCKLPNRCQSPAAYRRSFESRNASPMNIHEQVANAVNRLLKHFCKPGRQNASSLTWLWCGQNGLVPCLGLVFNYGFRSNRLFQRRIYVWDYLERVADLFASELGLTGPPQSTPPSPKPNSPATTRLCSSPALYQLPQHEVSGTLSAAYSALQANRLCVVTMRQSAIDFVTHVHQVARLGSSLGKEGRFNLLMCRGLREHSLVQWFSLLAVSPVTSQMYENKSFFLNHDLRRAIQQLLTALDEFELPMEPVLLRET